MNKKLVSKLAAFVSLLMCFLIVFNSSAFAVESSIIKEMESFVSGIFGNTGTDLRSVERVSIVPVYAVLQGKEIQMEVEENNNTPKSIEWSSSNENVISCTKDGKIKGLNKGKATITAKSKYGNSQDSITVYCAKKLNNSLKSNLRSFLYWTCKTPVLFNIKELMFNNIFFTKKVTVLGYYGDYFYVTYDFDGEVRSGFIWSNFLPSNVASNEIFRQLSTYETMVFCGDDGDEKLTTNYEGNISWAVSDKKVISFDSSTGKITGLKPGTATISATDGTKTLKCKVACVNEWYEPETSKTIKEVKVKAFPSITAGTVGTLPSGTNIIAKGDLVDGSGWVYITSSIVDGFIELTDFPGIDYLMTEYHYYDKGFEVRFGSPVSKIYDYASVLNDVMMENFNLKISPYVEFYTSTADQCKIWSYGSVTTSNLASQCSESGKHNSDSCLTNTALGADLIKKFGKSGVSFSKVAWTGHILKNNERSASTVGMGEILMTPYGTVDENNSYANVSEEIIREDRIYTLVHETGHQLGLNDHYCYDDISPETNKCSNIYCSRHYGDSIPEGCIMYDRLNVEKTSANSMFCDNCKKTIEEKISNS